MSKYTTNPFRYGNPVSPQHFIGREGVKRTIFDRLVKGESTAVVGLPHIGKTSFLCYIRDEQVRSDWLGETAPYVFVDIDCHLLARNYKPDDFWQHVLTEVEHTFPDSIIQQQLDLVRQSAFGPFMLESLFKRLAKHGQRVILLVDEFDVLLYHPYFNVPEFFGALRSISTRTDSLALLAASRMPITEMNRRSQEINPLGSPFFNNLIEVRLLPLSAVEVNQLLDKALEGTSIVFSVEDRTYILQASGRHPFLVQITAAMLFETLVQEGASANLYSEVDRKVQHGATTHFEDVWQHFSERLKRVVLILALSELRQPGISIAVIGALDQFEQEMGWLVYGGLIEQTDDSNCVMWHGDRWRIAAASFSRWLIDTGKWKNPTLTDEMWQLDEHNRKARSATLGKVIGEHKRRLEKLELQRAKFGIGADPAVENEIEDIEHQIRKLQQQLWQNDEFV